MCAVYLAVGVAFAHDVQERGGVDLAVRVLEKFRVLRATYNVEGVGVVLVVVVWCVWWSPLNAALAWLGSKSIDRL